MGSREEQPVNDALKNALDALAEANSQIELLKAHSAAHRAIRQKRKDDARKHGILSQTFIEAMHLWDAQKKDGVSQAERVDGLRKTLEVAWVKSPFSPPANICLDCHDVGWLAFICTPQTPCGRPFRSAGRFDDRTGHGRCTPNHDYATPCFCAKGRSAAASMQPKTGGDDFTQSTKGKKPRGFTPLGR